MKALLNWPTGWTWKKAVWRSWKRLRMSTWSPAWSKCSLSKNRTFFLDSIAVHFIDACSPIIGSNVRWWHNFIICWYSICLQRPERTSHKWRPTNKAFKIFRGEKYTVLCCGSELWSAGGEIVEEKKQFTAEEDFHGDIFVSRDQDKSQVAKQTLELLLHIAASNLGTHNKDINSYIRRTLVSLFKHLDEVQKHESKNMMGFQNLAIVVSQI